MKVAYSEKTQRKVNEKGGIDSLEKMHTKKRRKHKDGKTYVKQCKRRKRKSKEEISLEEEFSISQNIFQKNQKRQIKKQKKISQNIEKKEVKKMRTRNKIKIGRNLEKNKICKRYKKETQQSRQ